MTRRLDQALVAAGLADSRARAQALIAAGAVRVDGVRVAKPAARIGPGAALAVEGDPLPYVSRGGLKLRHALDIFGLDPKGAVDVGHGQLAPALRADPRLHAIEGLNARDLKPGHVPPPDWITADLAFISLAKALPPALALARPGATLVALVKPQFEVGRSLVGKGGIVRDAAAAAAALEGVGAFLERSGWTVLGSCPSPIAGGDGNAEFLVAARKG